MKDFTFEDIPDYYDSAEVRETVAGLAFSLSDRAELFHETDTDDFDIYDLYGTEYEDIILAFKGMSRYESWGMHGYAFKFNLTENLKAHIRKVGLDGIMTDNGRVKLFENITLYKGDKLIFNCCSHELKYFTNLVNFSAELVSAIEKRLIK